MTTSVPSGLGAQLGFKSESVYGTAVTVDKFLPLVSEGVKNQIDRMISKGIRQRRTTGIWVAGKQAISGPLVVELANKPLATLLRHIFGTAATTGAGPYTHTYSPGSLSGQSLTIQPGRPSIDGTVNPFTYAGCKIAKGSITCQAGSIAILSLDQIVAQSETTATALAAISLLSGIIPFTFIGATLTVAGSAVGTVNQAVLSFDNGLKVDRFHLGAATINEPLEAGERVYTVQAQCDFESLTQYARYTGATEVALVFAFTNGTDTCTITMNVSSDGDTPVVDGMDLLKQTINFRGTSTTNDAGTITTVLLNGETLDT